MRVALVVPGFPQRSETFIAAKAIGLLDRGMDLQVVCAQSDEDQWAAFGAAHAVQRLRPRVHVAPRFHRSWSGVQATASSLGQLRHAPPHAVARYLRAGRGGPIGRLRTVVADGPLLALEPDVVHFEFGAQAARRMDLRRRLNTAVTVSFRGYDLAYIGLDNPQHYQPVWEHADGIHVLGEDLWRRAVHRGAPRDLAHTKISPALDVDAVGPPAATREGVLGTSDRPVRITSVGRLHWKKGYDYALEAVATLRNRGIAVQHRIVGDGELLEAVAFWRHQLGLDDVVYLVGGVSHDQVLDHLRWSDVLLHASTSEGFANAVVEAQALGRPVVCSDADGLGENVLDGVTGFVVPRRDAAALADSLEQLAGDGDLRVRMGEAGRARVERHFDFDDHLDAWERFYADALTHRSIAP